MRANPIPPLSPEQIERFWSMVEVHHPAGCWEWTGSKSRYGSFSYKTSTGKGISRSSHRIAYWLLIGPIPNGLVLDHLCRNTFCVNPDHLEPVTNAVNVMRGYSPGAMNKIKTHCKNGHEFTPENIYTYPNKPGRQCRICKSELNRISQTAERESKSFTRLCERCSNPFWTSLSRKRFCSEQCQDKAWSKRRNQSKKLAAVAQERTP
jgi:hypothetical protein